MTAQSAENTECVTGVDMKDAMLALAWKYQTEIVDKPGCA
ncbi:protein of unknown function [Methylocaldum szegediense]|jgi:hypothetical protein|uniref:Uncharacterized protein n=1 Tax=Methylocaldum szegediense TaxID=73780 RepID=A0ABN8X8H4_9GAMM|nr:protein of unknown function [Methylocaldum szegediense]